MRTRMRPLLALCSALPGGRKRFLAGGSSGCMCAGWSKTWSSVIRRGWGRSVRLRIDRIRC